jgi:hypothetical protein
MKMTELMICLAKLVMGFILTAAPLMVLIVLWHSRDRRKSMIVLIVGQGLNTADLRGLVAAHIQCALLSNRCTVRIDMRDCVSDQMWRVIDRLQGSLPPNARLLVSAIPARPASALFSLEIKRIGQPRVRHASLVSHFSA